VSDAGLRRLERAARGGGAAARARWLRARLRAGAVSADGLRLAAYLGDPAAGLAAGTEPGDDACLERWGWGLEAFGVDVCVRAAAAAARAALPAWEAWEPATFAPGDRVRGALAAALAWSRRRDPAAEAAATEALAAATAAVEGASHLLAVVDGEQRGVVGPRAWGAVAAGWAAVACVRAVHHHTAPDPDDPARDVGWALAECVRELADADAVRAAVRTELAPWALGGGAPARDRVAAPPPRRAT